jgi:hypothetical protein
MRRSRMKNRETQGRGGGNFEFDLLLTTDYQPLRPNLCHLPPIINAICVCNQGI